jgi:hypothetical protein
MTTLASGFADFLLTEDGDDHRELEPAVLHQPQITLPDQDGVISLCLDY